MCLFLLKYYSNLTTETLKKLECQILKNRADKNAWGWNVRLLKNRADKNAWSWNVRLVLACAESDSVQANTARRRIFREYLRENEFLSKTIFAFLSEAQMASIHEIKKWQNIS